MTSARRKRLRIKSSPFVQISRMMHRKARHFARTILIDRRRRPKLNQTRILSNRCLFTRTGGRISSGMAVRPTPTPKVASLGSRRGPSQIIGIVKGMPSSLQRSSQGNNCFAIAAPPAARMAHFRRMARRRFGSSRPIASNRNAATRIIIETYRLANTG
jgi:hypothetical protein